MCYRFFYFLIVFSVLNFLGECSSEKFNRVPREVLYGHCYDIEMTSNFQPGQFVLENWYEIGRYDNDFEKKAECVYIVAKINQDSTWTLVLNLNFPNNTIGTVFGNVRPTNDSKFEVKFQGDSAWSSFSIVDTDYDNYGIIYSCWQKPHEPIATKQERLWILSKKREVTSDIQEKINKALHIDDIDLSRYVYETNQKTCSN